MAWLSRNNFQPSDYLIASYLNNLANDIRNWGGNVNGGGYTLSNVTLSGVQIEGSGEVTSVFGRSGDVVAMPGDYTPAMVGAVPITRQVLPGSGLQGGGPLSSDVTLEVTPDATLQQIQAQMGGIVMAQRSAINFVNGADMLIVVSDNPSQNRVDVLFNATGGGPADVTSVFGRTGDVVAQSGDYTAAMVTNAVDQTQFYVRPSWLQLISFSIIADVPNYIVDPTTTPGDLIVRGPIIPQRLPLGAGGQFLMADSSAPLGISWQDVETGGGESQSPWTQNINAAGYTLTSVGSILAIGNDGTQSPYGNVPNPALIIGPNVSPTTVIGEVFLAGGATTAGAVVGTLNYLNYAITGIDKRLACIVGFADSPGINYGYLGFYTSGGVSIAERMRITSAGLVGIGVTAPAFSLDIAGDCNVSGAFRVNGTPLVTGQNQSPWTQNVNAANYNLGSVSAIGIGAAVNAQYALYISTALGGPPVLLSNTNSGSSAAIYFQNNAGDILGIGQYGSAIGAGLGGQAFLTMQSAQSLVFLSSSQVERMRLTGAGNLGIGNPAPAYAIDAVGDCNITGVYRVNGNPIGAGGGAPQTPWLSNIDGGNYSLVNASAINIGGPANPPYVFSIATNSPSIPAIMTNSNSFSQASFYFGNDSSTYFGIGMAGSVGALAPGLAFLHMYAGQSLAFLSLGGEELMRLTNAPRLGIGATAPAYTIDAVGDCNVTGVYRVNGTPITAGMTQTPWLQNVNAATYTLGNVGGIGIGTSATASIPLYVMAAVTGPPVVVYNSVASSSASVVYYNDSNQGLVVGAYGSQNTAGAGQAFLSMQGASVNLLFLSGSTERMRLTAGGNLGIGNTSPNFSLDVNGDVNVTGVYRINGAPLGGESQTPWTSDINGDGFNLFNVANLSAGNVGIATASPTRPLDARGQVLFANPGWAESSTGTGIIFSFGAASGNTYSSIAACVNGGNAVGQLLLNPSGGNVGIGLNPPLNPPQATLHVNGSLAAGVNIWPGGLYAGDLSLSRDSAPTTGAIYFGNAGAYIYYDGDAAGWSFNPPLPGITGITAYFNPGNYGPYGGAGYNTLLFSPGPSITNSISQSGGNTLIISTAYVSDPRLKQNIAPLDGGLEIVNRIRPISAEWNGLLGHAKGERIATINAQELAEVIPYAVSTIKAKLRNDDEEETDVLSYDPNAILYQCVLAIQQLSALVAELEKKLKWL